jgi:hypothetical protein
MTSIPERFVYAWAEIQSMPVTDKTDPNWFAYHQLKSEVEGMIEDVLRRAVRIADQAKRMKRESGEVKV